jgi:hypothetical protein
MGTSGLMRGEGNQGDEGVDTCASPRLYPRLEALRGSPEGRGFTGCGRTRLACHSEEPQATRNLALS